MRRWSRREGARSWLKPDGAKSWWASVVVCLPSVLLAKSRQNVGTALIIIKSWMIMIMIWVLSIYSCSWRSSAVRQMKLQHYCGSSVFYFVLCIIFFLYFLSEPDIRNEILAATSLKLLPFSTLSNSSAVHCCLVVFFFCCSFYSIFPSV